MKKILLFLLVFCSLKGYSQPVSQSLGSASTQVYSRGTLGNDSGLIFRKNFTDTAAANLGPYIKSIPNIFIVVNDSLWKRNALATRWDRVGSSVLVENTTIFDVVLDSTLNQNSRILFSRNGKISSSPRLLVDSGNTKVVINNANVSVGGPNTKLWVTGNVNFTGNMTAGTIIKSGGTSAQFLMADGSVSTGSGGNTNTNLGAGYRWAVPNTNGIKTAFYGIGILADSTTNANGITAYVDTAYLRTLFVSHYQVSSLNVGGDYLKKLNDSSIYFDSSKVLIRANNLSDLLSVPTARTNLGLTDANIRALFSATGSGGSYDNTTGVFTLSGGSGWGLTGNAGTTAGTNFLGTTDNINLMFKRNSIQAGLVDSNAAQTGITLFGVSAGRLNTALASTGFGFQALFSNTTGASNTAMGNQALKFNTTGTRNTAFGFGALKTLAADNDNTAMGYNTLTLATGGQNTAFGLAAQGITTGTGNTAMGYSTLRTNTAGLNNVAIGIGAMDANTGSANIGIGYYALGANGAGSNNIAIGYNAALGVNTSGIQNIAIGQNSLGANTTASNSSAFGHRAGEQSTGAANTFIGAFAGRYITSETGVFVVNSLDRSTKALDQYASLIYGQNSTTDQKLSFNARVGLNTLAPTAWLHLTQGSAAAGFAPLKFDAPTAVLATTAASGTGAVATLTFAAESTIPYALGSTITVAGVTPAGYNATATVIASTTTSVSYLNTTTGAQTVAGTITQGPLLTTPENGAVEYDGADFYGTTGGVRYKLTKTLTGTAAPATTPATVGVMFVDTVNAKIYVSTGTASSADWTILN